MSDRPSRKRLDHDVPHWVEFDTLDPLFFVTICCQERRVNSLAQPEVWAQLHESIEYRQNQGEWNCTLFLAMPDHVHGLLRFEGEKRMRKVLEEWKRWTATQYGIDWQAVFFDHRLRNESSAIQKRGYILENPKRAGLVEVVGDWPYVFDVLAEE